MERVEAVVYHGSLKEHHGPARLLGECECVECILLPLNERRARLLLSVETIPGGYERRSVLEHVRWESFRRAS